jgi:hypothetical protein
MSSCGLWLDLLYTRFAISSERSNPNPVDFPNDQTYIVPSKMPKADRTAVDKRRANYKKNSYTQAWAEGRYTKAKGKGKGRAADGDDEEEVKVSLDEGEWSFTVVPTRRTIGLQGVPLVYATSMRAPGVVVNCMRGKEKKCGIELLAVFNNVSLISVHITGEID